MLLHNKYNRTREPMRFISFVRSAFVLRFSRLVSHLISSPHLSSLSLSEETSFKLKLITVYNAKRYHTVPYERGECGVDSIAQVVLSSTKLKSNL